MHYSEPRPSGSGRAIADCGVRNSESPIRAATVRERSGDCGLRIAEFGIPHQSHDRQGPIGRLRIAVRHGRIFAALRNCGLDHQSRERQRPVVYPSGAVVGWALPTRCFGIVAFVGAMPSGASENSPAIYRWVGSVDDVPESRTNLSPKRESLVVIPPGQDWCGTAEVMSSVVYLAQRRGATGGLSASAGVTPSRVGRSLALRASPA